MVGCIQIPPVMSYDVSGARAIERVVLWRAGHTCRLIGFISSVCITVNKADIGIKKPS
jgi:hypothetical protein